MGQPQSSTQASLLQNPKPPDGFPSAPVSESHSSPPEKAQTSLAATKTPDFPPFFTRKPRSPPSLIRRRNRTSVEEEGWFRSPKRMASFEEQMASLRQGMASLAAPPGVAAPDPRRTSAALQAEAAALKRRMAANRDRWAAYDPALASARSIAEQTLSRHEQLKGLKNQYWDRQYELKKALSVKLHNESNHKIATESVSRTTATIEELHKSLTDLTNVRDIRTRAISEELEALEAREAKTNEDGREDLKEAVSWYNKFLGFQVTGGEGVKFVFNKIDPQHPEKEYLFHIMFHNDSYNLVKCDPPLREFEEMVNDLNRSSDLLKLVRDAREKFQASSVNGDLSLSLVARPDVSSVPFSPPMTTSVNSRSEDVRNQSHSRSMNTRLHAKRRSTALSPNIVRRSPRLKDKARD